MAYITCDDITDVRCCSSCHEDWEQDYVDEMCMVYATDGVLENGALDTTSVGHVCCTKAGAARLLYYVRRPDGTT